MVRYLYRHIFIVYFFRLFPDTEDRETGDSLMEPKKKTMQDYIASCPEMIRANTAESRQLTEPLVNAFLQGNYRTIVIIACGSSMNASLCARPFLRKMLGVEVKVTAPFTFVTCEHDLRADEFPIVVSQSGYSLNAIEAADVIKASGRFCMALTGDLNSDLVKHCDAAADYGVGRETVGFVTRGVTALVLYFILFAIEAGSACGKINAQDAASLKEQLMRCADVNAEVQKNWEAFFEAHHASLSSMKTVFFCGVGANLGSAMEGALKFSETLSLPAFAYEAEEYIHGPNYQMNPDYTVFLIDSPAGGTRIRKIYEGTALVTEHACLITSDPEYTGDRVFRLPCDIMEEMTPLCILPFIQLTAWKLAEEQDSWVKHPLVQKMQKYVSSKSENYINSPFSEDTPGRNPEDPI